MILKPTKFRTPIKGHPLSKGLVGCWVMNEGSGPMVFDLSGNGNTAIFNIYMPVTAWMSGRYGSAIDFFGNDCGDGLDLTVAINLGRNPWTFICSVDVDDLSFGPSGFFGNTYVSGSYTRTYIDDTGKMYFYDDGNAQCSLASYVITGKHHYAIVFDGINVIAYRDGVYFNQAAHNGSDNFIIYRLMNYGDVRASSHSLDGRCDFVLLYKRLLSGSEIAQLYREPFCIFRQKPIELWIAATSVGAPPPPPVVNTMMFGCNF